jgi:hypothetical protein
MSSKRKIIGELKNRYNTDNCSSRKMNCMKLAKYKLCHPDWECIYAVVNEKDGKNIKKIILVEIENKSVEIMYYSGAKLFKHIFGEHAQFVEDTVKELCVKEISKIL